VAKKVLVAATVFPEETQLRDAITDADEIRVVAPATDVSWLDWLTNAEDDARREAREVGSARPPLLRARHRSRSIGRARTRKPPRRLEMRCATFRPTRSSC
jgi:hypothetical protein